MEHFEESLHRDLYSFLVSLTEVDSRLLECPAGDGQWEELAQDYLQEGTREPGD